MRVRSVRTLAATVVLSLTVAAPARAADRNHAPLAPTDLTIGDRARPLEVEGAPLFGWRPPTPRRRRPVAHPSPSPAMTFSA